MVTSNMKQQRKGIILYFCLLCAKCVELLEAPTGVKVTFLEPDGFYVEWDSMPYRFRDPITGYRIKLWAIKEETTRNYKLLNGEQYPGLERSDYSKEPFDLNHISDPEVSEITLTSPINYVKIKYICPKKLYEIRVMAYKGDEIGPMSEPKRVKLIKNPNFVLLAQRSSEYCEATIRTNNTGSTEDGLVYNSYL